MNFPAYLVTPVVIFTLMLVAFLMTGFCVYQVVKASKITKQSVDILVRTETTLTVLESLMTTGHVFARALINSSQTKTSIELCNILLSYCKYKSDLLTGKAMENNLSVEINNALLAIEALEEKRAVLESKIRQAYAQLTPTMPPSELESFLLYAQALQQETELEVTNTEKMKLNVFKVNAVLDQVLLQLQ